MSAELIRLTRNHSGEPVVSSLVIAELFDKEHKNVLRAIENTEIPPDRPDWGRLNFEPSSYINEQGKQQPSVDCTEAGALMLTMGFTGAKAAACRIRLIEAFQAQRAQLKQIASTALKPQSIEARNVGHAQVLQLLAEGAKVLSDKFNVLDDRVTNHDHWLGEQQREIGNLKRMVGRNPRREISSETRREHIRIFELRGCRCPKCERQFPIDKMEIDHFYENTRAKFEETWPLCRDECHRQVTDGRADRLSYERAFSHYQEFARQHRRTAPQQLDFVG